MTAHVVSTDVYKGSLDQEGRQTKHVEAIFFDAKWKFRLRDDKYNAQAYAVKSSAGYTPRWNLSTC